VVAVQPLLHDFEGERVLVFGGGMVGARRVRTFRAAGAEVVVVSPAFADADFDGAARVRAAPAPAAVPGWLDRVAPALIVAATNDEAVNDAVAAAADRRGTLCNRADRSGGRDRGRVAVPATVREGPVVVALSTGSPALTRVLRERVEETVRGAGELAALTGRLRDRLRDELPPERRRAVLRRVVRSDRVWKTLGSGTSKPDQTVDEIVSEELGEDEQW
jgi:precorrin-2 dehydrogenase/sirohydrochlorin ferrochelatase